MGTTLASQEFLTRLGLSMSDISTAGQITWDVTPIDPNPSTVAGGSTFASLQIAGGSTLGTVQAGASTLTTLSVTGNSTLAALTAGASTLGSLSVTGNSTVAALTAGASTLASLSVPGASTLGTVQAGASTLGSLSVGGASTLGTVQAGASTFTRITVSGGSTLTTLQAGASTLGSLSVSGGSTLAAVTVTTFTAGASTLASLSVSGGSTFAGLVKIGGQYYSDLVDHGTHTVSTKTLDWDQGNVHLLTLATNVNLAFLNPAGGGRYTVMLAQDTTGSRTVTWPGTIRWEGAAAPTLTTTASKTDMIAFLYAGGYYYGAYGLNF